jgi:hypothetical protein
MNSVVLCIGLQPLLSKITRPMFFSQPIFQRRACWRTVLAGEYSAIQQRVLESSQGCVIARSFSSGANQPPKTLQST